STASVSQSRCACLAVIGLLKCNSTFRRPLPSIYGSSEAALLNGYSSGSLLFPGIELKSYKKKKDTIEIP
ncbi:MAG: hypothetical protein KKH22_07810, partial [Proteobacteria bacterium]|nr:hypothetical protein [Pseudomonadota bacterium]